MAMNFYFDEIFHDSKIVINEDKINIFLEDKNDMYVGVFWGDKAEKYERNNTEISAFENKYKKIFEINKELKSQTFHRKNFLYGIKTFNRNTLDFYSELFDMIDNINPIIQVTAISKCELLLREIFNATKIRLMGYKDNVFFYSMTKFIITYYNKNFDEAFYKAASGDLDYFKRFLMKTISLVIERTITIDRKKHEYPMLYQLLNLISEYEFIKPVDYEIQFEYSASIDGLINLLHEKKIRLNKVNLFIDNCRPMKEYACQESFRKVSNVDSESSVEIRFTDWICGFYGRMMRGLSNDIEFTEKYESLDSIYSSEIEKKHTLSKNWFEINKKQFDLYKKAYSVLYERQGAYWACMTGSYGDQISMFYSLLRYFGTFNTYEEFISIKSDLHKDYYNTSCCRDLQYRFESVFNDIHRD